MTASQPASEKGSAPEPRVDLTFPILFQKMDATMVEKPGEKEPQCAYEVTFIAVLSEAHLRFVVNFLKDHKILVMPVDPNNLKGE